MEAQNDGYQTGPEIGTKVPDFTLPDQHGRSRALAELIGIKWAAAGLQPQRRLVTLLPQPARRAAALLENSRRTGSMPHELPMTRVKFSKHSARLTTSSIHSSRMSVAKLSADSGY